ncbi:hypothetical protein JL720_16808 [Aureococcus anophagefferens]|nr:hypothetical protein JL720_16808 [Aureococcus anophagefferens]
MYPPRQRQGRWGDRRAASQQPEPPRGDPRGDYVVRGAAPPAAKRSGDRRNVMRFVERETASVEPLEAARAPRRGGDGSAARSARGARDARRAGHRSPSGGRGRRRPAAPRPRTGDDGSSRASPRRGRGALPRLRGVKADETATTCVSPPPPGPAAGVARGPRRHAAASACAKRRPATRCSRGLRDAPGGERGPAPRARAPRAETDDAPPAPAPRPASPPEVEAGGAAAATRRVSIFASHEAAIADAIGERCASTGSTKCLGDLERAIAARHRRGFVDAADVRAFAPAGFAASRRATRRRVLRGLEADERGRVDAREIARLLRDVALEHAGDGPVLRSRGARVSVAVAAAGLRATGRGQRRRGRASRTAPVDDAEDELYDALAGRRPPPGRPRVAVDVREMMDDEPQLFGEGSREAFRECCRRVAKPVAQADVDALFHLVDDDRDGVASKRELIHFARDPGGEWARAGRRDGAGNLTFDASGQASVARAPVSQYTAEAEKLVWYYGAAHGAYLVGPGRFDVDIAPPRCFFAKWGFMERILVQLLLLLFCSASTFFSYLPTWYRHRGSGPELVRGVDHLLQVLHQRRSS